jgi:YD repeat-containing protein
MELGVGVSMEQTQITYDAFGNPIQVVDAAGRKRTFGYDPIVWFTISRNACLHGPESTTMEVFQTMAPPNGMQHW